MNNFPARHYTSVIDKIREDVRTLRCEVPVFASWRGGDLQHVCERYANILIWLAYWDDYRIRCADLLVGLPEIQACVRETISSGDWRSFNQAAYSLQTDMDELMAFL